MQKPLRIDYYPFLYIKVLSHTFSVFHAVIAWQLSLDWIVTFVVFISTLSCFGQIQKTIADGQLVMSLKDGYWYLHDRDIIIDTWSVVFENRYLVVLKFRETDGYGFYPITIKNPLFRPLRHRLAGRLG